MAPSPENFSIFLSENGEFWCILGGACALYVATAQESDAEEEGRERALVKDDILHLLIGERPIHQILYFHQC